MPDLSGPAYTADLIRERVARKRAAEGLSLRDLAAILGVQPNALCRFENGKGLTITHFLAIAEWAGFELRKAS